MVETGEVGGSDPHLGRKKEQSRRKQEKEPGRKQHEERPIQEGDKGRIV